MYLEYGIWMMMMAMMMMMMMMMMMRTTFGLEIAFSSSFVVLPVAEIATAPNIGVQHWGLVVSCQKYESPSE